MEQDMVCQKPVLHTQSFQTGVWLQVCDKYKGGWMELMKGMKNAGCGLVLR